MKELRDELNAYYARYAYRTLERENFLQPWFDRFDAYAALHPEASALALKAGQYELLAEHFEPVLFRHSPFYGEMGVKVSEYDGGPSLAAGGWLFQRRYGRTREFDPEEFDHYVANEPQCIHLAYDFADHDHHCFPFGNVLTHGLEFFYRRAAAERARDCTPEEAEFLDAAMRGLLAVRHIAEKFGRAAEMRLAECGDPAERSRLEWIARTAPEVPWRSARTFQEGLAGVWFLHEICASIEGVGMSVIGHLDRYLGGLYREDIAAGRLTPEEAYDWMARLLLHTDCRVDNRAPVDACFNRQEQGDTLILGGCDADGNAVFNDVTFLVLRAHRDLGLIYPKIHCRIGAATPRPLLDAVNRDFLTGRNVISFLNDDALIPAQVKAGKRLADARGYVAGGCWETIVEGCEHSAGANCYFNLARIMDLSIHDSAAVTALTGDVYRTIDGAPDFEAVYRTVIDNAVRAMRHMCEDIRRFGELMRDINPAPFFSACLNDCLEKRRDYTAGGGRYNPHGVPLASLSVWVDSLAAIRHLCWEKRLCTLEELLTAVRNDWRDAESLRRAALTAPHWGDGSPEPCILIDRTLHDLQAAIADLYTERGGHFQLGIYNYRDIIDWARRTRATPNGRRGGDWLTQGLTPGRLHAPDEITTVFHSCAAADLGDCAANSVLTVSLARSGVDETVLAGVEQVFAASGAGMLQLNCLNREELEAARRHPENHSDLIVRLYGYSARFVALSTEMQEEFISRQLYS